MDLVISSILHLILIDLKKSVSSVCCFATSKTFCCWNYLLFFAQKFVHCWKPFFFDTKAHIIIHGWHGVLMHWLSIICWLMYCRFDHKQKRSTLCCLYVAVCGSYLRCVTRSTHVCIIHGGVNCLNSVPYRCYTYA